MLDDSVEGFVVTAIGNAVFSEDGWDQYLEDEVTIWLVHWLLETYFLRRLRPGIGFLIAFIHQNLLINKP
ncbi:DUF4007 family protein [Methylobacter sp. S3L5C]|uniref:DUF4007 family protein n=1 Tax=Methylobacter sp. S3L5C TaxID=2839024 RepID=UPI00205D3ABB|nr:DUF4007 family protein [Methylobacter sp. S3L5C]